MCVSLELKNSELQEKLSAAVSSCEEQASELRKLKENCADKEKVCEGLIRGIKEVIENVGDDCDLVGALTRHINSKVEEVTTKMTKQLSETESHYRL